MFPIIHILGKDIGTYSLCSILGLAACVICATVLGKKLKFAFEDVILFVLAIIAGILVGGHLLYGITNFNNIVLIFSKISVLPFKTFISLIAEAFGGMVYYGGFIGAYIAVVIYTSRSLKEKRYDLFDLFAVCVPLFHAFGRIGCFFGGCCYGVESRFGITVHNNPLVPELNDVSRLPIQLIESFCNFMIFLTLLFMFKKFILRKKLIYVYMVIYAPIRFVLEFFRGDAIRGFLFFLSTSQWISILLFVFGAVNLILRRERKKQIT